MSNRENFASSIAESVGQKTQRRPRCGWTSAVFALVLSACAAGDVSAPLAPAIGTGFDSKVSIAGPTHELRITVDNSGTLLRVDAVRVRSVRANFQERRSLSPAVRMTASPEKQRKFSDSLSALSPMLNVVFYELPQGAQIPRRTASTTEFTGASTANSWSDATTEEEAEAAVDAAISDMIAAQEEYLYLSEEESSEVIRVSENTFSSMQLAAAPTTDCIEEQTLQSYLSQPCNVTTKRNTLSIARGKVVMWTALGVGAMAAGAVGIASIPAVAAAAGITVAAAWTGWNVSMAVAFMGSLGAIVDSGLESIVAKWELEDCKRSTV